jgi:chromatin segregation and condensation protein Rec8/ScpA/Scc1 (kleisin family)
MKSWIANTKINALLEDNAQKIDGVKLRIDLIAYCDRYQKNYPFEILEEPLEFLKENVSPEGKYKEVSALLRIAAEEYCISLNEIADALLDLIDTRTLTTDQAKKIINHVFEAFSCNESPEDFLPREDAYLCENLFAITFR